MSKLLSQTLPITLLCLVAFGGNASAFPTWMGSFGPWARHDGGNPGVFTVLMNQDYLGLHAEIGLQVDGGAWEDHPMEWAGHASGNSVWRWTPEAPFPAGAEVVWYFRSWDDWGGQLWDSAGGKNHRLRVPLGRAEDWLRPLDRGLWLDEERPDTVHVWVDFEVAARPAAAAARLHIGRSNGVVEQYLAHLEPRGWTPDGHERWGTDLFELTPDSVHHGPVTHLDLSYQVQADADGDGSPDLVTSTAQYELATPEELAEPAGGLGQPEALGPNPPPRHRPVDTSLADDLAAAFADAPPPVEAFFSPYDDPEQVVRAEIEAVTRAARAGGRHTIHAAVFDINDPRIVDALIEAHRAGVEVRLLTAGYHMAPWRAWETEYPRLQRAGVEVVGIQRDGALAASMHTKLAVFDGRVVMTGSYNWERVSADDNCENLLVIRSEHVAAVYERLFAAIAGEPAALPADDPQASVRVLYSLRHDVPAALYAALQSARDTIHVAMFTLRHLTFAGPGGQRRSVLDALVDAARRGVDVQVVLEANISDEGEYYGRITPDDPTDEWLAEQGVTVVEIHTEQNGNRYAAMHHKFAVVDGELTLTGAYNWAPYSQRSDDDLVVIRDRALAARYIGEHTNLRRHWDPDFDPRRAPATGVRFEAQHPHTRWGQTVAVVGSIPELGAWDPAAAVLLDPSDWPRWSATVPIPSGTWFEYKLVTLEGDRVLWEPGANRTHTAAPGGGPDPVRPRIRR